MGGEPGYLRLRTGPFLTEQNFPISPNFWPKFVFRFLQNPIFDRTFTSTFFKLRKEWNNALQSKYTKSSSSSNSWYSESRFWADSPTAVGVLRDFKLHRVHYLCCVTCNLQKIWLNLGSNPAIFDRKSAQSFRLRRCFLPEPVPGCWRKSDLFLTEPLPRSSPHNQGSC